MAKWGYDKGEGRWYKRATGTRRFPDSGVVKSNGTKLSNKEIVGHHTYGVLGDAGGKTKFKKKVSKIYQSHSVKGKRKKRGGYRRRLR